MKLPEVEEQEIVFDAFIKIRRDRLCFPDGSRHVYYSLLPPASAVVVLALTPEGYLLLNSEYRHPTGKVLLGLPGGYLNPGEDPLAGARRELLEETGYSSDSLKVMGSAYPFPGLSQQKIFYVLMENVIKIGNPSLDPMEIIEIHLKHPDEVLEAIREGSDVDGTLCTAFFFWNLI